MREEGRVVGQDWLRVGSRFGDEKVEDSSLSKHHVGRVEVREEHCAREEDAVPVKREFREEGFPEEACRRDEAVPFRDGAACVLLDTPCVNLRTDDMIDLVSESSDHLQAMGVGELSARSSRGADRLLRTPHPASDDASVSVQPSVYSPNVALAHLWHSAPLFPPQISIRDDPRRQLKSDITLGNRFEVAEDDTEFIGRVLPPSANGEDIVTPGGGRLNVTPDYQRLHSWG